MFNRNRYLPPLAAIASISMVAGCGVFSSDASDDAEPIVVGTTSTPSTLDPAAAWDSSWELFRNVYQTLLGYPPGAVRARARRRRELRVHGQLQHGVQLHAARGPEVLRRAHAGREGRQVLDRPDQEDQRQRRPRRPAGTLVRVQAKGDREVVFHLNQPDATFPFVLTTPAMSIVDPEEYPADKLREDGKVIGSGPYNLESYEEGKKAELVSNDNYKGFAERKNAAVTIRYFQQSAEMVKALRDKKIDVIYRGLGADGHRGHPGQRTTRRGSSSSRAPPPRSATWCSTPRTRGPRSPRSARPSPRSSTARRSPTRSTRTPSSRCTPWSPGVWSGHTTGFFDDYGDPDASKAEGILADARHHRHGPAHPLVHHGPLRLRRPSRPSRS